MFSRQTKARIGVLLQSLWLAYQIRQRRDDETPLRREWFAVGLASGVLSNWAYDNDVQGVRTSRWRRFFRMEAGLAAGAGLRRFVSDTAWRDYQLGTTCSGLCYRLWYGVLRPLPYDEE